MYLVESHFAMATPHADGPLLWPIHLTANSVHPMHERAHILDRYDHLAEQAALLRQRLSLCSPSSRSNSTTPSLPSPGPTSRRFSQSWSQQSNPNAASWSTTAEPLSYYTSSSTASSSTTQQDTSSAIESQIFLVNQQIKTTLTSLLNCDEVKHDRQQRAWVQQRLMDAERELKQWRRRRSSADREEVMRRVGGSDF